MNTFHLIFLFLFLSFLSFLYLFLCTSCICLCIFLWILFLCLCLILCMVSIFLFPRANIFPLLLPFLPFLPLPLDLPFHGFRIHVFPLPLPFLLFFPLNFPFPFLPLPLLLSFLISFLTSFRRHWMWVWAKVCFGFAPAIPSLLPFSTHSVIYRVLMPSLLNSLHCLPISCVVEQCRIALFLLFCECNNTCSRGVAILALLAPFCSGPWTVSWSGGVPPYA